VLQLTQAELARELGTTASAISQWEAEVHRIPGPVLKLVELFERDLGLDDPPEPSPSRALPNAAALGALVVFLGVSTRLVGESLGERLRAQAFRRYVDLASKLRGLSVKTAQLAGNLAFALPDADRLLAAVNASVEPMTHAQLARIFREELDYLPHRRFGTWSDRPFATGSVGQVHAATLPDGREVAVKVQYPDMRRAFEDDLEQCAPIERLLTLVLRSQRRGVLFRELCDRFLEETDYTLEARRLQSFARAFADRSDVRIPDVYPELSSRRVLVMSRESGQSLHDFARSASQEDRDRAGGTIWEFFQTAVFRHRLFQTDPNPGNFLLATDRVTFLDFGRVQALSTAFVEKWKAVMRAAVERDHQKLRSALIAIGHVPDASSFYFDHAKTAALAFYRPWLSDAPFVFTPGYLNWAWRLFGPDNPNLPRLSYTAEMAFMTQLYFGVGAILARLGSRLRCRPVMLDLLYAPGEDRPEPFSPNEIKLLES
jgi:predicted unusual protein kinase regulating ubiquinone biosynthesis (AarF/ABC1/UbiB family)